MATPQPILNNQFLRPLGSYENAIAAMHECRNSTLAFTTWIESKILLTDDIWDRALKMLQINIPQLRLNIECNEGNRYFLYMENPRVDFEILNMMSDGDWQSVHEDMMRELFLTKNAPLWKVKVLRMPKREAVLEREGFSSDVVDCFTTVVVFGIHHSIMDGTSNILMLKRLLQFLNAITEQESIEENDIVKFQPEMEALLPEDKLTFTWRDYYHVAKAKYHQLFAHQCQYLKQFSPPLSPSSSKPGEGFTRTVAREFTVPETEAIMVNCKKHGATVHGAFLAAASLALDKVINGEGSSSGMDVTATTAVNMRRYMHADFQNAFGCFFSLATATLSVPVGAATYSTFWELAKRTTRIIHSNLNNGGVIQERKISSYLIANDSSVKRMLSSQTCTYEFGTSNVGDCDKLCPQNSDNSVHATRVITSSALPNIPKPMVHYLHKFCGRFCYNLDYGTNRMTDVNAVEYVDMTVALMKMAGKCLHE